MPAALGAGTRVGYPKLLFESPDLIVRVIRRETPELKILLSLSVLDVNLLNDWSIRLARASGGLKQVQHHRFSGIQCFVKIMFDSVGIRNGKITHVVNPAE